MKSSAPSIRGLQKLLEGSVQRARGDESFVMPEELFQKFESNGLDVNGATSSGFSENGRNLAVGVTVNVAALAGFPALVKFEVTGKVEGGRGRRTMLVLRRLPAEIGGVHRSRSSLCFLTFDGVHWTLRLGVEFAAGAGPPDDFEGLTMESATGAEELSVDLKVGAAVGLSGGGGFFEARAEWPEFYSNSSEQALRDRFRDLMADWKKDEIKDYAAELLNRISDETPLGRNQYGGLRPKKHKTLGGLASPYHTDELRPLLQYVVDNCNNTAMKTYRAKAVALLEQLNAVKDTVKSDTLDWLSVHHSPKPPVRSRGRIGRFTSESLKAAVEQVLLDRRDALGRSLDKRATSDGENLVQRLAVYVDDDRGQPADNDPRQRWRALNQFKLLTYGGVVEATASAKAGIAAASTDPNAEFSIKGAQVAGKAGITGQACRSSFRFQCWLPNDYAASQPLVTTQDTIVDYRQVNFEATANGKAFKQKVFKKEVSKQLYNSLHWNAAIGQWLYPTGHSASVELLTGSGYCQGISVQYSRFFADGTDSAKRDKYFAMLSQALGTSPADLARFAVESWLLQQDGRIELPNDVILLEAAFVPRAKSSASLKRQPLNYSEPGAGTPPDVVQLDESLLGSFKRLHRSGGMALQSIRAGWRMADYEDNGKTRLNFKLGLREGVEAGIQLRSIAEAGFDSVIEIATWWADPDLAREPDQARACQRAVPRTALFHQ